MAASLVLLLGNAEAERVFSCQNRIKSKSRQWLGIDQLDKLIRVSYSGPDIQTFNFQEAANIYLSVPRKL